MRVTLWSMTDEQLADEARSCLKEAARARLARRHPSRTTDAAALRLERRGVAAACIVTEHLEG